MDEITPLQMVFIRTAKLHRQTVHARLSLKDVYPGQPPLLRALSKQDGQSQRELAELMQITPATLNVMIGRMEKTGLLVRRPDESDQRVSRVYLTEQGHSVVEIIGEEMNDIEALSFAGFTEAEQESFRSLLLRMHDNLQKAGDPS
jgi:MarR family transcriptional regulator, organic hydroperoxide resistance regulator